MYCPAHFEENRPDVLQRLIEEHPLATVISNGKAGLRADHIPLLLSTEAGQPGKLIGHVARNNPLWQAEEDLEHLLVFQGPSAYVSPNWYASKTENGKVVPTWNYAVVHVHARMRAIHDQAQIRSVLEAQTLHNEAKQTVPWNVTDAPEDFTERLLGMIVGLEFKIVRLQGKWKVSQNQSAANRESLVQGLTALPNHEAHAIAELVGAFAPSQTGA